MGFWSWRTSETWFRVTEKNTETSRRLAMISIDNAVELMSKTCLGLPRRVTGLNISRKEYQDFSESFPRLLDALEKYANDKLDGIELGEIEWYHRLRNQLYHQGNGLTVEKDKVEIYAELANVLFANLFGFRLVESEEDSTVVLGDFIQAWVDFEKILADAASRLEVDTRGRPIMPLQVAQVLESKGLVSESELEEISKIRRIRNEVIHGVVNYEDTLKPEMSEKLMLITDELKKRLESW